MQHCFCNSVLLADSSGRAAPGYATDYRQLSHADGQTAVLHSRGSSGIVRTAIAA